MTADCIESKIRTTIRRREYIRLDSSQFSITTFRHVWQCLCCPADYRTTMGYKRQSSRPGSTIVYQVATYWNHLCCETDPPLSTNTVFAILSHQPYLFARCEPVTECWDEGSLS